MSCSSFTPSTGSAVGLDPAKRVNYQLGLVLGEDEFRQDQFHHRERDHLATRALHGYGTVSGLAVAYDPATDRLEIEPGLAVDPAGRLICVPVQYCGSLGGWVRQHVDREGVSGGPPTRLFLTLCWTESATDDVPIPSDSCLSAEDSRAASRVKDSFEIKLVTEPPALVGEVAPTSAGDSIDALVAELRGLLDAPSDSLPTDAVDDLLRDWVVRHRPEVVDGNSCLCAPEESCVLLAQIDFAVIDTTSGPTVDSATVQVNDADRPILVTTRLLQEALFAVAADMIAPDHPHTLEELTDVDVAGRAHGEVLTFDAGRALWVPLAPTHAHSLDDLDDVATRGAGRRDVLVFDGARWGPGSVAHEHSLDDLDDVNTGGAEPDDVLVFDGAQWAPRTPSGGISGPAGGDLTGAYPDPRLAAIQRTPVSARAPAERNVLILREGEWIAGRPRLLPFATIFRHPEGAPKDVVKAYIVWFNLDVPGNPVEVLNLAESGLEVFRETEISPEFMELVGPLPDPPIERIRRNVFKVFVADDAEDKAGPLRFRFPLQKVLLTDGISALDWASSTGTWFVGESNDDEPSVTVFVFAGQIDLGD